MGKNNSLFLHATILVFAVIFQSCSNTSKKGTGILIALQQSLETSNEHLNISTEQNLRALEVKTTRPETTERAGIWFPKAKKIKEFSKEIEKNIEGLKKTGNVSRESILGLYDRLVEFNTNVLGIDPEIGAAFMKEGLFEKGSAFRSSKDASDFFSRYFKNNGRESDYAVLTTIQNDVLTAEDKTISFCLNKIGMVDGEGFYSSFSALVSQNSKVFKPGDDIEIFAGMGTFTRTGQPEISINNLQVPIDDDGVAKFRRPITEKPGKYSIPVSIRYFDQVTGAYETKQVNIEYTVTVPCNQ